MVRIFFLQNYTSSTVGDGGGIRDVTLWHTSSNYFYKILWLQIKVTLTLCNLLQLCSLKYFSFGGWDTYVTFTIDYVPQLLQSMFRKHKIWEKGQMPSFASSISCELMVLNECLAPKSRWAMGLHFLFRNNLGKLYGASFFRGYFSLLPIAGISDTKSSLLQCWLCLTSDILPPS
jgi:hypothetical protein